MPLIQVTMLKGRTIEQKRKLAARITDAMVEDAKAAKEAVVITPVRTTPARACCWRTRSSRKRLLHGSR